MACIVEGHEPADVFLSNGSAEGTPGEIGRDALGAGAFLLGGLRYRVQDYNAAAARVYSSMMLIAVVSLAVPSAFSRYFAPEETIRQETLLNLGLSCSC